MAERGEAGHVTVPMLGMVESLNISATVAVVLTEVTRQRCVAAAAATTSGGGGEYRYEGQELEALVSRMVTTGHTERRRNQQN